MLLSLAIGDVVLIDEAEIEFGPGLCVLTGETGAGKSILLDSLGLALGMRASAALVRDSAGDDDTARAQVSAAFSIDGDGPVPAILEEHALELPEHGEPLILRRSVDANGRSRAYVNDQPVSAQLLRRLGETLVEIEGQFASQGLMDETTHRDALDAFAGLLDQRRALRTLWRDWRAAADALAGAEADIDRGRREEEFLRHAAAELAEIDPRPGEETALAETRTLLMNGEKLIAALSAAETALTDGDGVEERLGQAARQLAREADKAGGRFDEMLAALDRATDGVAEALVLLHRLIADAEPDPARLESCEERLFALRALARKHGVEVDGLPELRARFESQLAALNDSGASLDALVRACGAAREAYLDAAESLSTVRRRKAAALDEAVMQELPALRLEKASFRTVIERRGEDDAGPTGLDRVRFEVTTNPGMPPGPLARIASGGELARFLLALKVVLHRANGAATLVFDEVDAGIGGAAAAAVGDRLAQLARSAQVLVVTHSPQVAAFADQHLLVSKRDTADGTITVVDPLADGDRREEIARMLAGARITDEARAAADRLIAGNDR